MKRKIEIDILKGFLIIFVVIGHIQAYHDQPHEVIFWFHMPAFFMVSGYFMHAPKSAPWHDRAYLSKQIRRYVVPFFAWCVVGYALVRHESLLKNIVRVLYAGHNNITPYSYPYWFINALFTGSIALACIQYKLTFGGGKAMAYDNTFCHTMGYCSMDITTGFSFALEYRPRMWSRCVYGYRHSIS